MGLFSKFTAKLSAHSHEKRSRKAMETHHSHRQAYLLNDDTPFNVTEAFRNLKATLSVSVPKKEGGVVIMATSAYPTDGKTTVTANLSLMFAQSNARVLLVDADIRKGSVAKYYKAQPSPGLSDYLSGQSTLEQVVHKSPVNENLSLLTCGTHSPRSYELLESDEMKKFLRTSRSQYDYVIIDTPPVLVLSDALAIAPETDGVLFVCRHQASYVSDIERALDTLNFAKANVLGVVVNDYKNLKTEKYYGYKNYYYYNNYAYDSTDSADKNEGEDD